MKRFLFFVLLFFSISLFAQAKYDNIWLLNNNGSKKPLILNWEKKSPPDTSTIPTGSEIIMSDPNASICDKSGKLMYYSSGCAIAGRDFKILPNGKQINPGWVHENYCYPDSKDSYPAFNNIVFLPNPTDTNKYYLFHTARKDFDIPQLALPFHRFLYTEIDASQGKYGVVTKKNIILVQDSLSEIGSSACKHANGIDWWIIVPTLFSHSYHRALLTKDSVSYIGKQKIEEKFGYVFQDWAGQSVFSPNGKKYVRTDPFNGTYIYDFDRCTGLLSSPVFIDTLGTFACSGASISPNSKYLYLSNQEVLYQFDIEAKNILDSRIKIADRDNFLTSLGYPVAFYKAQLAPDNKIYIGGTGSIDWLSIIHRPDEKGLFCDFRQHDFKLPRSYFVGLPNMPHYRMPKLEDVDCSQKVNPSNISISLFPNPSQGQVHIKVMNEAIVSYNWELYDELGRLMLSYPMTNIISDFELPASLKNGIYFWRILNNTQQLAQGKLVLVE